ncbi:MAG: ABC transporter permease [Eubacteriales bacterium]
MTAIKQFRYVFAWQLQKNLGFLIFSLLIQALLSAGIVIGFTYLLGNPEPRIVLYLATGAPTLMMITTGLVIVPQQIASAKLGGELDFIRTWPVRRGVIMVTDAIIWLLITIPGIAFAAFVAHILYEPGYAISLTIIPSVLLTGLSAIGIGYGLAYILPPMVTMVISQVLVFGTLMFSPVNYPMENLPEWLQAVHNVLPIHSMAEVIRASLAKNTFTADAKHYIILSIWCVVGFMISLKLLNKR